MGRGYLSDFSGKGSWKALSSLLVACLVVSSASTAIAQDDAEDAPPAPTKTTAPAPVAKPQSGKIEEEAAKEAAKKEETVKTGVIAAQVNTGTHAAVTVDADTTTAGGSPGEESNIISGSIIRNGRDRCVAKVTNGGKSTYSISFVVQGTNERGATVLNQYYSATLKPNASVEKTVSRCDSDLNLAVVLKSARALK